MKKYQSEDQRSYKRIVQAHNQAPQPTPASLAAAGLGRYVASGNPC